MKKPTKQELRNEISELKCELFRAICQLPEGELKKKLVARYPDYYTITMIDKYGSIDFMDVMAEIGKQPINETGKFIWYERSKSETV